MGPATAMQPGPIMVALAGAGVGAVVGGLTGALIGMGMRQYEARQYEDKMKGGNILVSVHTEDGIERDRVSTLRATQLLRDHLMYIACPNTSPMTRKMTSTINRMLATLISLGP
jgi:Na+/glutamate symporter